MHDGCTRKASRSLTTTPFGTNEFIRLCQLSGAEPYLAANVRSLRAIDFDQWVEYCNSPADATTLAKRRAALAFRDRFTSAIGASGTRVGGAEGISPLRITRPNSGVSRVGFRSTEKPCNSLPRVPTEMIWTGRAASSKSCRPGLFTRTPIFLAGRYIITRACPTTGMLYNLARRSGTNCFGAAIVSNKSLRIIGPLWVNTIAIIGSSWSLMSTDRGTGRERKWMQPIFLGSRSPCAMRC